MNHQTAGTGQWLLRRAQYPYSLGAQQHVLDKIGFAQWQAQQQQLPPFHRTALLALLGELWQDELTDCERTILESVLFAKKSEAAIAREMGMHHSAVNRIHRRALEKLRRALDYATRYRQLLLQAQESEED